MRILAALDEFADAGSRIATQKVDSVVNAYRYDLTDQLTNALVPRGNGRRSGGV